MAWTLLSVPRFATSLGNEVLGRSRGITAMQCRMFILVVSSVISTQCFEVEGVKYDSSSYFTAKEEQE